VFSQEEKKDPLRLSVAAEDGGQWIGIKMVKWWRGGRFSGELSLLHSLLRAEVNFIFPHIKSPLISSSRPCREKSGERSSDDPKVLP